MRQTLSAEEARAYEADRRVRMQSRFLICGILSCLGYVAYGMLDFFVAQGPLLQLIVQTRAIFLGVLICLTGLSQTPLARRHPYMFAQFLCSTTCMGAVVLTTIVGPDAYAYHLGVLLVLVGWTALMPWRVQDAIASYMLTVLLYAILEYRTQGWSLAMLITTVSYLIAVLVSALSVAFTDALSMQNFTLVKRLEVSNAEMQKMDAAKNAFFANISHELRTPIMLVLASLENIRDACDPKGAYGHQFAIVQRNGMRLLRMVDDLLELTRLQSSTVKLSQSRWMLNMLLEQQVEQATPMAVKKDIKLQFLGDRSPVNVFADRDAIERVVENLLANALKFTPVGGSITVTLLLRGNDAEVSVTDTGRGISKEDLPRVFERFYQGEGGREVSRGGVGIGLSMCQKVVQLHEGSIRIDSALGKGTAVMFALPKAAAGNVSQSDKSMVQDWSGNASALLEWDRRLRKQADYRLSALNDASERRAVPRDRDKQMAMSVLVVDDDRDLLELISGMVAAEYNVFVASDGQEGFDRTLQLRPDIIISDVVMPGVDGFAMLAKIRQDPRIKDTPVILMTARGLKEDRQQAGQLEADDFLPKPFTARELHPILKRHLRRQKSNIDQVEKASQLAVSLVVSGLAHDIMNPVSFLRTANVLLERNVKIITERASAHVDIKEPQAACEKSIAVMGSGLQRVVEAVEQLKKVAKGQDLGQPIVAPITPLVQRTMVVVAATAKLKSNLDATSSISIKPGQLERVLLNLMLNAIQAGGEECDITVNTADDVTKKLAIVEVIDNGPGMDAPTLERIFEPHFTTKATGSGLGLAMCRDIIKTAGGHLYVDSEKGKGTKFVVALPSV